MVIAVATTQSRMAKERNDESESTSPPERGECAISMHTQVSRCFDVAAAVAAVFPGGGGHDMERRVPK